jgi:predicted aspartyl protease
MQRSGQKFFASFFQKRSAFLAFLLVTCPAAAAAECLMNRVADLPITLFQDKLFIPVSIDGTERQFFIDTGAGITTISADLAAALSLPRDFDHTTDAFGVGGMESHLYIAHTQKVDIGGQSFANMAFPTASFAEHLADGSTPGGLIGADLLSRFDLDIDIPHRRLGLWRVAGCTDIKPDWPGDSSAADLSIQPSRHASVPVRLDGTTMDLLLDTGSPGLVVSTRAAARAGVTPDVLEESRELQGHGVNNRAFTAWLHIFQRLEVAGQVFGDARAVIVSNGRMQSGDGLLGVAFLKRGRVWVSYATGKLFVEKTGTAAN